MNETFYVAIEGPIGVGKTTLARILHEELGGQLLLEVFEENPFLSDFYADRARYAFQTQIFFLLSRYRQQYEMVPRTLALGSLVSDYLFAKDRLFARLNLGGDELAVYEHMHAALGEKIAAPSLVVHLPRQHRCADEPHCDPRPLLRAHHVSPVHRRAAAGLRTLLCRLRPGAGVERGLECAGFRGEPGRPSHHRGAGAQCAAARADTAAAATDGADPGRVGGQIAVEEGRRGLGDFQRIRQRVDAGRTSSLTCISTTWDWPPK